jgi:hypothetical protein
VTRARATVAARLASDHVGRLLHIPRRGWHVWTGRRWIADQGETVRAVLDAVQVIVSDPSTTPVQIADARRCESATELVAVLRIAATLPALSGTAADLTVPEPALERAPGTRWAMAYSGSLRGGRPAPDATEAAS